MGAAVVILGLAMSGHTAYAATPAMASTVATAVIGGQTLLVGGASGKTLYTANADVANSGVSTCLAADGCSTDWPPLTVPAGTKPTGGAGVVGTLGTIVRSDDHMTQVTYNGRPLYFDKADAAAGTAVGNGDADFKVATPVAAAAGAMGTPNTGAGSGLSVGLSLAMMGIVLVLLASIGYAPRRTNWDEWA